MRSTRTNTRGNQRGHYVKNHRPEGEDVTIENCTIGRDSPSGKAVLVTIEDKDHWMPLSQIRRMTRTTSKGGDTMVISAWIAGEKGLA